MGIKCKETLRDMMTELRVDMKWVKKELDNHLSHHFRYTIIAFATALSAIATLIITLLVK